MSGSLAGVFCAVLVFARVTNATPVECAAGGAVSLLAMAAINAIGNGGLPIAADHEAWLVLLVVPPAAAGLAALAGRISRRFTAAAQPPSTRG